VCLVRIAGLVWKGLRRSDGGAGVRLGGLSLGCRGCRGRGER